MENEETFQCKEKPLIRVTIEQLRPIREYSTAPPGPPIVIPSYKITTRNDTLATALHDAIDGCKEPRKLLVLVKAMQMLLDTDNCYSCDDNERRLLRAACENYEYFWERLDNETQEDVTCNPKPAKS